MEIKDLHNPDIIKIKGILIAFLVASFSRFGGWKIPLINSAYFHSFGISDALGLYVLEYFFPAPFIWRSNQTYPMPCPI
jgi:hypothetical protein